MPDMPRAHAPGPIRRGLKHEDVAGLADAVEGAHAPTPIRRGLKQFHRLKFFKVENFGACAGPD